MTGITKDYITEYLRGLYFDIDPLVMPLEEYAAENLVPIIEKESLELLKLTIKMTKSKKVLELGTAIGYSSICMAGISEDIKITSVDIDENNIELARANIKKYGKEKQISLICADAKEAIKSLNEKYDLIFIDAAKSHYLEYLKLSLDHIKEGTIIFSDNVLFKGLIANDELVNRRARTLVRHMREYLRILTHTCGMVSSVIPIGDGVAISIIEDLEKVRKNIG